MYMEKLKQREDETRLEGGKTHIDKEHAEGKLTP